MNAQMTLAPGGYTWFLVVVPAGPADEYPEKQFPVAQGVPTVAARRAALAHLGYAPTCAWEWSEEAFGLDGGEDSAVVLVARVPVAPIG